MAQMAFSYMDLTPLETTIQDARMRRCTSQPSLHTMSASSSNVQVAESYEVFVSARPFKDWAGGAFRRLPPPVRDTVVEMGLCHYLVILRSQQDGRIVQFDFGPTGGDIHIDTPTAPVPASKIRWTSMLKRSGAVGAGGPLSNPGNPAPTSYALVPGAPGEIREEVLEDLPPGHMYVGTTTLSLEEIRLYNSLQSVRYELHQNDCRHYVNNLVHHATGFERSTIQLLKHSYSCKVQADLESGRLPWHMPLVQLTQWMTDVSNWESVKRLGSTAATAMGALMGVRLWGGLKVAHLRLAARVKDSALNAVRSVPRLVATHSSASIHSFTMQLKAHLTLTTPAVAAVVHTHQCKQGNQQQHQQRDHTSGALVTAARQQAHNQEHSYDRMVVGLSGQQTVPAQHQWHRAALLLLQQSGVQEMWDGDAAATSFVVDGFGIRHEDPMGPLHLSAGDAWFSSSSSKHAANQGQSSTDARYGDASDTGDVTANWDVRRVALLPAHGRSSSVLITTSANGSTTTVVTSTPSRGPNKLAELAEGLVKGRSPTKALLHLPIFQGFLAIGTNLGTKVVAAAGQLASQTRHVGSSAAQAVVAAADRIGNRTAELRNRTAALRCSRTPSMLVSMHYKGTMGSRRQQATLLRHALPCEGGGRAAGPGYSAATAVDDWQGTHQSALLPMPDAHKKQLAVAVVGAGCHAAVGSAGSAPPAGFGRGHEAAPMCKPRFATRALMLLPAPASAGWPSGSNGGINSSSSGKTRKPAAAAAFTMALQQQAAKWYL